MSTRKSMDPKKPTEKPRLKAITEHLNKSKGQVVNLNAYRETKAKRSKKKKPSLLKRILKVLLG